MRILSVAKRRRPAGAGRLAVIQRERSYFLVTLSQFFATRSDLYVGYARALTGEVWYKNMLRVEFRYFF